MKYASDKEHSQKKHFGFGITRNAVNSMPVEVNEHVVIWDGMGLS